MSAIITSFPYGIPGDPYLFFWVVTDLIRLERRTRSIPLFQSSNFEICSKFLCVSGAKAAEALLPNLIDKRFNESISSLEYLFNKEEIIVGTTLNQVHLNLLIYFQKLVAENFSHTTRELLANQRSYYGNY